jgi:hypothetical protein
VSSASEGAVTRPPGLLVLPLESSPNASGSAWVVTALNLSSTDAGTFTIYAICAVTA